MAMIRCLPRLSLSPQHSSSGLSRPPPRSSLLFFTPTAAALRDRHAHHPKKALIHHLGVKPPNPPRCSVEPRVIPPAAAAAEQNDFLFLNGDRICLEELAFFTTLGSLHFTFHIFGKRVLNAFPYPFFLSVASLATASFLMLASWVAGTIEPPETDLPFWTSLFPVAAIHTVGLVAEIMSLSKMSVSFANIIRCGQPVFGVLLSRLILRDSIPQPVYLSLLPIIGGCSLAAVTELNFNMTGFITVMIANLAFASRNIVSDRTIQQNKGKEVGGANYYACLSMLSLLILAPFALAIEGPKMWAAGWQTVTSQFDPGDVKWCILVQSVCYHLYNVDDFQFFPHRHPFSFIMSNTTKKISVIVASILFFHTPVQNVNALGAAIAVLGIFLYSREICKDSRGRSWFL